MKFKGILIALVFFLISHSRISLAQEIHAVTDAGEKVVLLGNGTWHFLKDPSSSITKFEKSLSAKAKVGDKKGYFTFFYDTKIWQKETKLGGASIFSFTNNDANAWLKIIEESIPLSYEEVRNQFLESLKSKSIDAKIISEEKRTVNGVEINYLVFDAETSGIWFRYYNYIYSGEGYYIRNTAFTYQKEQNEDVIISLLNGFQINPK